MDLFDFAHPTAAFELLILPIRAVAHALAKPCCQKILCLLALRLLVVLDFLKNAVVAFVFLKRSQRVGAAPEEFSLAGLWNASVDGLFLSTDGWSDDLAIGDFC